MRCMDTRHQLYGAPTSPFIVTVQSSPTTSPVAFSVCMLTDVITYLKNPLEIMITPSDDTKIPRPETEEIPQSQFDEPPQSQFDAIPQPQIANIPQTQTAQSAQFPIADKAHHPPPYADLPPSVSEAEWKEKLNKLEKKIRKYNWTKQGDEAAIVQSMRDLAASHSDPQVQAYWTHRANEFERAPDSDKKAILTDIGRGLAILIAAPFVITGALLIGTGMLLKAGGDLLTGGRISKMSMSK